MLHTDSAAARRSEMQTRRKGAFARSRSHAPSPARAPEDATVARTSGPNPRDFDALDWLRFWLPESDWHVRHQKIGESSERQRSQNVAAT